MMSCDVNFPFTLENEESECKYDIFAEVGMRLYMAAHFNEMKIFDLISFLDWK